VNRKTIVPYVTWSGGSGHFGIKNNIKKIMNPLKIILKIMNPLKIILKIMNPQKIISKIIIVHKGTPRQRKKANA
jgi:hypothetical protein